MQLWTICCIFIHCVYALIFSIITAELSHALVISRLHTSMPVPITLFISVISIFFMFFTHAERNYDIINVNEICRYLYCYLNQLSHYYELVNIWILSGKSVITVYLGRIYHGKMYVIRFD